MSDKIFQHKNFESDTVHGHNFHVAENTNHPVIDKENQSQFVNANKLCDEYAEREMQKEKENNVKKVEYREYLMKQMHDKKKKNNYENASSMTPFPEESNANDLKIQKQKEEKQNLDDCIKMKYDMKLKSQLTELEEEQKRSEFWKKRNDETIHTLEKAKQKTERKETSKNEVALLWQAEKRKDVQRDKFINALIEKNSIIDLNKHHQNILEIQKSIRMKKELVKENEEKIVEWMKNLELLRKEQEKLKNDIEHEEELEQKLGMKSNVEQNAPVIDEAKKVLQERNYQCANNRFFGIE